ncbi:hypothetical protein C8Q77DRAFT_157994 [Trametes polyzona]|nr:hypothetical protein C8Q77DRAFT_157994 [Trametes polyzona]
MASQRPVPEHRVLLVPLPSAGQDECSLARARHLLNVQVRAAWKWEYRSSSLYVGRRFLRLRVFNPPNPVKLERPALSTHGQSKAAMRGFAVQC